MPELPEVETIVKELQTKLIGRKVSKVRVLYKGIVRPNSAAVFVKNLRGCVVKDVTRRGKLIIFNLSRKRFLLAHLKMTGQFIFTKNRPDKHTHVVIEFVDGGALHYRDIRKFGFLFITDTLGVAEVLNKRFGFGPEPLSSKFTSDYLIRILAVREAPVKAVLLNQKLIAGLGNIYADEILFAAGINPKRAAKSLTSTEVKSLHRGIIKILTKAIKLGGSSSRNYIRTDGQKGTFQNLHKVYKRAGLPCLRCQSQIARVLIAGRGTHFCPKCQI